MNILIVLMYLGFVLAVAAVLLLIWIIFTVPKVLSEYSLSDVLKISLIPFEPGSSTIKREHHSQLADHRKMSMIFVSLVCTRLVIGCASWVILSFYPEIAIPELKAKSEGCLQQLNSTGLVGNCDIPKAVK